jgi:hypothetical protein
MSIGELADAAGLSRRAIRFYVQQGLLPAPERGAAGVAAGAGAGGEGVGWNGRRDGAGRHGLRRPDSSVEPGVAACVDIGPLRRRPTRQFADREPVWRRARRKAVRQFLAGALGKSPADAEAWLKEVGSKL